MSGDNTVPSNYLRFPCPVLSALLEVFDNIMHMLVNNSSVDMVYHDFSKAFDKVDHA